MNNGPYGNGLLILGMLCVPHSEDLASELEYSCFIYCISISTVSLHLQTLSKQTIQNKRMAKSIL